MIRIRESSTNLNEKTYTIGDTQYWKRSGKFYSWTQSGGRVEISEDEYRKAIESNTESRPKPTPANDTPPNKEDVDRRSANDTNLNTTYTKLDKSVGKGYNGVEDSRMILYDKGLFGDLLTDRYNRSLERYKDDLDTRPDFYKEWYGDVTPEEAAKQSIIDGVLFNANELYTLVEDNPDTLIGALYRYQYFGANPNGEGYGTAPGAREDLDKEFGISKFIEDNEDIQYNTGDTLYRGLKLNNKELDSLIKAVESNSLIDNRGCSSWTSDSHTAKSFTKIAWTKGKKSNRVVLVNENEGRRKAMSFCGFSNTESQKEVIYSGNQKMMLDKYETITTDNGDNIHYFYVKDVE